MYNKGTRAGFTIVELLVVITITIILMGLIFGPIISTYDMTRQANTMVAAQNTARTILEQISREISQAMFVYDNSNSPIIFPVQQPDGTKAEFRVLYGKIDLILPKLVMHCNDSSHPDNQPRDYERGDDAWPKCPVCGSDNIESRPKQPLVADSKIVRYFVGLANNDPGADPTIYPAGNYRDWPEVGAPLNGFILYRAEVDPYDTDLFEIRDGQPVLDDPNFFYGPRWREWKAVAKPVGPQTDIDLVILRMDESNNTIRAVVPSVRFQPSQITNDSFEPAQVTDEGIEAPTIIPTVFRATYGAWASSIGDDEMYNVSVIRNDPETGANVWYRTVRDSNRHLMINRYAGSSSGVPVFDITEYERTGVFSPSNPDVAFVVDPVRGEVRFDFPASDQIHVEDIIAMNSRVAANVLSGSGSPARAYRITQFANLSSTSEFKPRIVPGSEVVIGPDMTPGLDRSQIRMVRYERVPFNLGDPGRNQYKIDYGMYNSSNALDRVGWIIFSPAYDEPIPTVTAYGDAYIDIKYKFQCNRDSDVVVGNYATKTLMQVTLGIRYYNRNSGKVHPVELTNKVRVRNLMR